MFEELIFMGGFLLFSIVVSYLLLKYIPDPLNKIVRALAIVGIIIHELCHILMCLVTNAPVESVKLIEKVEIDKAERRFKYNYVGRVTVGGRKSITFLQAILVSLAPLLFSFWLFFFLWTFLLTYNVDVWLFFLIIFVMMSIVLAAAPSSEDLLSIPAAFQEDPRYSTYQIFLLALSIITVWLLNINYRLIFFHEIIFYILIMGIYYAFKYGFIAMNEISQALRLTRGSQQKEMNYKEFTRRRYKPAKPKKNKYR